MENYCFLVLFIPA